MNWDDREANTDRIFLKSIKYLNNEKNDKKIWICTTGEKPDSDISLQQLNSQKFMSQLCIYDLKYELSFLSINWTAELKIPDIVY